MSDSTATVSPTGTPHRQLDNAQHADLEDTKPPRDIRFWLIFLCLCVCSFVAAIEIASRQMDMGFTDLTLQQGSITTVLPTIVNDLHGTQFIWVGSAFALGSTALIPLAGGLAQVCINHIRTYAYSSSQDIRTPTSSSGLAVAVCSWECGVWSSSKHGHVDWRKKYVWRSKNEPGISPNRPLQLSKVLGAAA